MTPRPRDQFDPAIHRVRLDRLTIFEITEAELEALELGSPDSIYLNLGIAATSFSTSFLVALLTTTINDVKTFCVFVIVCASMVRSERREQSAAGTDYCAPNDKTQNRGQGSECQVS